MNKDKWNEICFLLSENIKNDISENLFEQNVIKALGVLGWKEYLGNLEIRRSHQLGAAGSIIPDIVVKSDDNRKLFVIEIKQPSIPLTSAHQLQLLSYMRQYKFEYGILIGQNIQILYDGNLTEQEDFILLEMIRFERNSERGEHFVELFSKENFNFQRLNDFTVDIINKLNRKEEYKILKDKILSENYKEKLADLIKQDFINEYDGELIDSVLNELNIEISIRSKFEETNSGKTIHQTNESNFDSNNRDYTKYFFNGQTLGKNRLVLAVIKEYVKNNPSITFNQLKAKFPDSLQGSETFTTETEAKQKRDRRNFIRPDELISLIDTTIAVSTQWGLGNITRFIDQCKQMNIEIKQVN